MDCQCIKEPYPQEDEQYILRLEGEVDGVRFSRWCFRLFDFGG